MNTSREHYARLLARHYTWMTGGHEKGVLESRHFFRRHDLGRPFGEGRALDLGAGSGYQSIALAAAGFRVTAVDLNEDLLEEIHRKDTRIDLVPGDMTEVVHRFKKKFALCVCMGDTLTHLTPRDRLPDFFAGIHSSLESAGRLVLTFRNYTAKLRGMDRFIPVAADDHRILTCFLEYFSDHVVVHDLLYSRSHDGWQLEKSAYRKSRLDPAWVANRLLEQGFILESRSENQGMSTILARHSGS